MRGVEKWISYLFIVVFILNVASAEASVIFNEIFSDPASGLMGDANGDGVRSGTQDEFVEILNNSPGEIDISGWSITDNIKTRHIFPFNTVIDPHTFLVVFGGGSPMIAGINWQVASTGSLGLNNDGDSVTLFDSDLVLMDQVIYGGIGNKDQSINLFSDGEGSEFFLHSTLEQARGALFSPGTSLDSRLSLAVSADNEIPGNPVVPELPTLIYIALGWGSLLFKKG